MNVRGRHAYNCLHSEKVDLAFLDGSSPSAVVVHSVSILVLAVQDPLF